MPSTYNLKAVYKEKDEEHQLSARLMKSRTENFFKEKQTIDPKYQ